MDISNRKWGIFLATGGVLMIVLGITNCLHHDSGSGVRSMCLGILFLLASYFGYFRHGDRPLAAFEKTVLVACGLPAAAIVVSWWIMGVISFFSSLPSPDEGAATTAAWRDHHYRKPEVGEYYCPHCRYVFGRSKPENVLWFNITCPGCGRELGSR